MPSDRFSKLLEPATLGRIQLRNRMIMAPMGTRFPDLDGSVNQKVKAYFAARARGGVGLIIVEATEVDGAGRSAPNHLRIDDDRYLPGLSELAGVIRESGTPVVLQLLHGGRATKRRYAGADPVGPSAIAAPGGELPRELTRDEIPCLVQLFAAAARRAKAAGFDGVEIHGAHTYLINNFLSPASNQRQDEYGGTQEKRARFALEVTRAVREAVGPDYTVLFRLNGHEYGLPGGLTVEDCQISARLLDQTGLLDGLHVSSYGYDHTEMLGSGPIVPGLLVPFAAAVKRLVKVPVIAVGRIDADLGERLLREGQADLIAMGRGLLADPELPNKVALGQTEDIRPCLSCMLCRDSVAVHQVAMRCTVNLALGRESEPAPELAARQKKVLVVGGGPAGLHAAAVAAQRGHRVTLFERAPEIGGLLRIGGRPPFKGDMTQLAGHLANQARKSGVDLRLGCEATPDIVVAFQPDAVVISAGARPVMPDIAGSAGQGHARLPVVMANDVLGGAETGLRVVVIGGEMVGCETAEFLADRGKSVVVVRRGTAMATKVTPTIRTALLLRLAQKGVRLLCGVQYKHATPFGLIVESDGKEELLPADTLVIAAGAQPGSDLADALAGPTIETHIIGDCREPRGILEALAEGEAIGRSL